MTHETLDQIKLAQHRLIAKKLRENPEAVLGLARRNLRRYIGRRRPAPATSLWREWLTLLEQNSIDRIVTVMTAKTERPPSSGRLLLLQEPSAHKRWLGRFNARRSELKHIMADKPTSPNGLIPADCDPPDAAKLLECPGLFDANEPLGPQ